MGYRERRRAERHRELIEAAMELVIDQGIGALSLPSLAEAVDASVGGLYRYFPSKDALHAAVQIEAVTRFGEDLLGVLEAYGRDMADPPGATDLLGRLLVGCFAYFDDGATRPRRHALIDALVGSTLPTMSVEAAREIQDTLIGPILGQVAELVAAAQDGGALSPGDPMQRTFVLWGLVQGIDRFRKRDRFMPEALHARRLLREGVAAMLTAWGADPDALEAALEATG